MEKWAAGKDAGNWNRRRTDVANGETGRVCEVCIDARKGGMKIS